MADPLSYAEALRRLGMWAAGGNHLTLRKYVKIWGIPTDHFDPLCGQGEDWRGRRMGLILDHINGVAIDNRIENLPIVCPNCASTLDTHCGRNLRLIHDRTCEECGAQYRPTRLEQRFCSLYCGRHHERPKTRVPRSKSRKVPRPTYEQLKEDLLHMSWLPWGGSTG